MTAENRIEQLVLDEKGVYRHEECEGKAHYLGTSKVEGVEGVLFLCGFCKSPIALTKRNLARVARRPGGARSASDRDPSRSAVQQLGESEGRTQSVSVSENLP